MLFAKNDSPTLGVELELQIVDEQTMGLVSKAPEILAAVPDELETFVKPELMQCYLEINTEICPSVQAVEKDLLAKLRLVQDLAADHHAVLFWGATHPFSPWAEQRITDNERYHGLVELLQDMARRLVTFGLHVHVGVDSGDKAIMICDRILRHLPTLLALSSNSPFWNGRVTGLHSQRSKVMENLPTAGLPPLMRNWSEYVWLINHLIATEFINTIREIWWDVRPHHKFGTVEVRICDMPASLPDVLGLVALVQCLVQALSEEIAEGTYQHDCHPMMVRQNKWRACRFGMDADLVDPYSAESLPAREVVGQLVDHLLTTAQTLECVSHLEHVLTMADLTTGSKRQLEIFEDTGDHREVVRQMAQASRV